MGEDMEQQPDAGDRAVREAATWFAHLLDAETPQADYIRFREWLQADDRNARAYARIEQLWGQAASEPLSSPGRGSRRRFLKTAGGIVVLAGGAAIWTATGRADFSTGKGEIRIIGLPDGSTAQLSAGSALSLVFDASARHVRLHGGEAFFTVKADARRPFMVEAGPVRATALGTAFSVSMGSERTAVTVTEHNVRVEAGGRGVDLREGEAVDYENGMLGHVVHGEAEGRLGWRNRQLVFLSRPLGEVVAEINRWRAGRLMILDAKLASRRVTAILDVNDIARIDQSLEQGLPVTLTSYTPLLTVVSANQQGN